MSVPRIIIVGADSGGVGKTTVSRVLLDYFIAKGVALRAFDTEAPTGNLKRFYPEKTTVVDLTRSDDQMKIFDTLKTAAVTVIDLRAGLLSKTLRMLSEIGFLNVEGKLAISLLHVLGSTAVSFAEITATAKLVAGAKHFLVLNHINNASYLGLTDELKNSGSGIFEVDKLNELAAEHVDRASIGFDHFCRIDGSAVLQGYVRSWRNRIFKQFDDVKFNEV